jgi:2-keto-4-pentenoate hydratase/2-oxohepta-3-ene-1,7-dioic acid hydratase in catechol pathway
MKLARCTTESMSVPFIAAEIEGVWRDLTPALEARTGVAGPFGFEDVLERVVSNPTDWESLIPDSVLVQGGIKFLAPVPRPPRIFCLGRNFAAHAAEHGHKVSGEPIIFSKSPLCVINTGDSVEIPEGIGRVDPEIEIAFVVARTGKNIQPEEAMSYVAGYTLFNDVTARAQQFADMEKKHPWFHCKSHDTFGPIGPYLITPDEFGWPPEVGLNLKVNGEVRQEGNTKQFVFDIPTVLSYVSRTMRLVPGDVFSMGTPEGVAPVVPGDVMDCEADKLGVLSNPVA